MLIFPTLLTHLQFSYPLQRPSMTHLNTPPACYTSTEDSPISRGVHRSQWRQVMRAAEVPIQPVQTGGQVGG